MRNRRQLLERLREYEREGLGGIPKSEVAEALPNPEKAIKVCACVCVCVCAVFHYRQGKGRASLSKRSTACIFVRS